MFPVVNSYHIIAGVINAYPWLQHVFQIERPEHIIVVEQDNIVEAQLHNSLLYGQCKTLVVYFIKKRE